MIIDCLSDLHGYFPQLDGGDLLIVAGDLTKNDTPKEYFKFFHWFDKQKYKKRILIGGNHDNIIQEFPPTWASFDYLLDSGTEFENLKIWGSPWISGFIGMNQHCMAFTLPFGCDSDEMLEEYWQLIPDDIDILITHSPPFDIFDETMYGYLTGSRSLLKRVLDIKPRLHIFGHIHEQGGKTLLLKREGYANENSTIFVNASYVNENYEPVNKPIRIII